MTGHGFAVGCGKDVAARWGLRSPLSELEYDGSGLQVRTTSSNPSDRSYELKVMPQSQGFSWEASLAHAFLVFQDMCQDAAQKIFHVIKIATTVRMMNASRL